MSKRSSPLSCHALVGVLLGGVLLLVSWGAAHGGGAPPGSLPFTYYAVFKRVASPESLQGDLFKSALSGDGRRIYFASWDRAQRRPHLYEADCDNPWKITEIPLPPDVRGIGSLTTNRDGSRAFFARNNGGAGSGRFIFKVEGGRATPILGAAEHKEINGCFDVKCTADGRSVYFREDRDDLWRVNHTGGAPERIIDDRSVQSGGKRGAFVKSFDISDSGGVIAFVLAGCWDPSGAFIPKTELFVRDGSTVRQLTDDPHNAPKLFPAISGDGAIIAYASTYPTPKWRSIDKNGGSKVELETLGINPAGADLTTTGRTLFYSDFAASGGRLVATDGSGGYCILPSRNVSAIAVSVVWEPWISGDGRRCSFRDGSGLYVGYFTEPRANPGGPSISDVVLDPPYMPKDDPAARVVLRARIQGGARRLSTDSMLDGRPLTELRTFPVNFYNALRDDGKDPDQEANDRVYAIAASPGGAVGKVDRMTVRLGAMDDRGDFVVADVLLGLGSVPPDPGRVVQPDPGGGEPKKPDEPDPGTIDPGKIIRDPDLDILLVSGELLVTVYRNVTEEDLSRALAQFDFAARILDRIPLFALYKVGVPADRLREARLRLANHPLVAACGYNTVSVPERTFNDPALAKPDERDWGLRRIEVPAAWDICAGGAVIAVVDSGCLLVHEELAGKTSNPYSYSTDSPAMETGAVQVLNNKGQLETRWVTDHGTHVAVTAAGRADNSRGTAGVAPDSPVVPVQVLYYNDKKKAILGSAFEINRGIERAINSGAQVVNLSLGMQVSKKLRKDWLDAPTDDARAKVEKKILATTALNLESYKSALDTARTRGVVICKSAGNQSLPAKFDGLCYSRRVIAVAATNRANGRASFSNYGAYTTVSAPGRRIYSALENPSRYGFLSGTSMAAPHVSGLVGLLKTLKPSLTFEEARDILIASGEELPDLDRPIGPQVNARAALEELRRRIGAPVAPPPPDPPLIPQPPGEPTKPPKSGSGIAILNGPEPWKNAEVQRLIDLWLSIAIPPADPATGRWFYDKYGRMINPRTMDNRMAPDWASYRHRFIWERARRFTSTNAGTLYDFVVRRLRGGT